MMDTGDIPDKLEAINSCAPYGMMAWNMQEEVSRSDAVFLGSMLYCSAISFAIGAAMMIATVLLAHAMSIIPVNRKIPSMPALFPFA